MKVLHVIPSVSTRSGGPAEAIVPMCRALEEIGIEVLLATTNSGLDVRVADSPVEHRGVPTVFFPSQLGESFKFSRPMSVWLNENVGRFDIVHIHAVFNHACVSAATACRKLGVPYIIRPLGSLDPWSMKQKRFRKQVFWRVTGRGMMQAAAAVHYTTRAEQDAVESSLGLDNGRVIPLGIDSGPNDLLLNGDNLFREYPMLSSRPYVLVMSRLHPKKAIDVLIDAFLTAVEDSRYTNWRLAIAGEGPTDYVNLLRQKVIAQKAQERIVFTGWLEGIRKQQILKHSSLLALTSFQENFGVCVMEALNCSVPVIVSPHVNLANEIKRAGAGWVVEVERDAIAQTLRDAFSSDEDRLLKGRAGKHLCQRFSWPEIARELVSLYSSISPTEHACLEVVA
jgi:glycosyltransferase involved in cell wall biosynthesis